jgi:hypothetical protein
MPHRISAFVLAVLATSLAAAAEVGKQGPASAAGECLEKFDSQGEQAGHWYYRTDHVNNRKCWFLEKATVDPPTTPTAPGVANGGSEESWLSQLATRMQALLGTQDPPAAPTAATGCWSHSYEDDRKRAKAKITSRATSRDAPCRRVWPANLAGGS